MTSHIPGRGLGTATQLQIRGLPQLFFPGTLWLGLFSQLSANPAKRQTKYLSLPKAEAPAFILCGVL